MIDWLKEILNADIAHTITLISIALFVISVVIVIVVIVLLPADYFKGGRIYLSQQYAGVKRYDFILLALIKNFIGLFLLLAGLFMLVLPGQGILTILVGLIFLDFPGKRKIERGLLARPGVLKVINRIRSKWKKKAASHLAASRFGHRHHHQYPDGPLGCPPR